MPQNKQKANYFRPEMDILQTIYQESINNGSGATMEQLIQIYQDVKGPRQGSGKNPDHTRSIQRIIRGINEFFDPNAYARDDDDEEDEASGTKSRRTIVSRRNKGTTYYWYQGQPEGADYALEGEETLIALNPEMRNILRRQQQKEARKIIEGFLGKTSERRALYADLDRLVYYADPQSAEPEIFQATICQLLTAMRYNQQIRFDYRSNEAGALKTKELAPYGLVHRNENWYLYGQDLGDKLKKIFLVSNIQKIHLEVATFTRPRGFNLADEFSKLWGIFGDDGPVEKVRLQVSAAKAYRFQVTRYHPSQQGKRRPDGTLELTMELRHPLAMIPWLLSWGGEIIPLEPASLREAMEGQLQTMLQALK